MKNFRGVTHGALERRGFANIADAHDQPVAMWCSQPVEIALDAGSREVVEEHHSPSVGEKSMSEVGSDETASASDQRVIIAPDRGQISAHFCSVCMNLKSPMTRISSGATYIPSKLA